MQKVISDFFHRLGVIFSVIPFVAFWLIMADSSADIWGPDIIIMFSGCVFIYCMARFIGWMVNGLVRE